MPRNILLLIAFIICGFLVTLWIDQSSNPIGLTQITPQPTPEKTTASMQETLPDFQFTTLDGKTHNISDFHGKIVLLNFWATWCPPCVVEFPKLVELSSNHRDVVLIALSNDLSIAPIEKFIARQEPQIQKKIATPSVLIAKDNKGKITADLFQTYRLPETIIIDKNGKMVKKIVGDTDWESKAITSLLGSL